MDFQGKLISFLAVFLFLSAPAIAADTAFEGWLYSGQSITAEGRTFIIHKSASNQEMFADFGSGSLFVKNNSCQQDANVRLCLDNIEYYLDARSYRLKVRAISLVPDISVTRTAQETEFEAGHGTTITVSISNSGGLAENVVYTDNFPEGIVVESADGALKTPTGVRWERRSLKAGTETFSYNIRADEVIDRSFVGVLEYFNGISEKTIRTPAISIKTTPRLLQEFKLGSDEMLLNQKNNFTINLTNKETGTANVTILLSYDPGLRITHKPNGFRDFGSNQLKANFLISKRNATNNRSQDYYFEFTGEKTGTFSINAEVSYSTSDFSDRKLPALKKEVDVSDKGIEVRTNLDDIDIESGQERTLRIWLQNLNPAIALKNIFVSADGGGLLYLPDSFIGLLSPNEHSKIVETRFFAPRVNATTGNTIRVNVSYLTEFGQNFSKNFEITSTIEKINEVTITKTASKQELESGEDITVTVKVKNPRKTRLNSVSVSEEIPPDFSVFGATSAIMTLALGDEQTAYTYVITAPRIKREASYLLNTTVAYSDANAGERFSYPQDYIEQKSLAISVKPQKFELTGKRAVDDLEIFLGDYFYSTYTIKNPSDDTYAKNIVIKIPLQEEFDIVGGTQVVPVADLSPGEEVTLLNEVAMRAKKEGDFPLSKTPVYYENEYGEMFSINITETTIKVAGRKSQDTFVFISKNTTPKANNTDEFLVSLLVTNFGSSITPIVVEDGSFMNDFAINNGSSISFSYLKKISAQGKHELPAATASYSFEGKKLLTGSNRPVIEIVDNPVVIIEKNAPVSAGTGDRFDVIVTVRPLAAGIMNVTISDEDFSVSYPEAEGVITETHSKEFSEPGKKTLGQAKVSYIFNGIPYTLVSGAPSINILEEAFLTINKSIELNEGASKGDVLIEVANVANDELTVVIDDSGRSWTLTLAPGEKKTLKHKAPAQDLESATATFNYKGRERVVKSNIPESPLGDAGNGKVIKEENEVGIIGRLLNTIKAVLTWQR